MCCDDLTQLFAEWCACGKEVDICSISIIYRQARSYARIGSVGIITVVEIY